MKKDLPYQIREGFRDYFSMDPEFIIRAPGRVNLIGEHTDYNGGFVLPMAINRAIWFAIRVREDTHAIVQSLDFNQGFELDCQNLEHGPPEWGEYIRGSAWALIEHEISLRGWEGVILGNIPIGAGLSSSAALEIGTAKAFSLSSGFEWEPVSMARITQLAENRWVGVQSGIMDQTIVAAGRKGSALLIDCRTLDLKNVPLPEDTSVVIMDTMIRRGLLDSAYNERRAQCEAAASALEVTALRDVSREDLAGVESKLEPVVYRRAMHVVSENERVLQAVAALQNGDAALFGTFMNQSHASLRDDFEVSCGELDIMVSLAQELTGCYGARMTGGGFGGCAVALVASTVAGDFVNQIQEGYRQRTDLEPNIYLTTAGDGVSSEPA